MEILLLAFALAMGSVVSGVKYKILKFPDAVKAAFIFGIFQALISLSDIF